MPLNVTYAFYTGQYGGTRISAEAWPAFARDAIAYVDAVTFGRITDTLPADVLDRCCMAVCAVAEHDERQSRGGEIASESLGRWSQTYVASGQSPAARRYAQARLHLAGTGLLYRGVCV